MEEKTEKTKGKGRPSKYNTKFLIKIIKLYISKTGKPVKVNATALVKFAQETLNITPMHYQYFTRNKEVKAFIDEWNNDIEKALLGSKNKSDGLIYSTIDIDRFLHVNKNEKKTRQILAEFNDNMYKLTTKYNELEKKLTKQIEVNLKLENKLEEALKQLSTIEKQNFEKNKEEKQKRIQVQKTNDTLRKKVYLYEEFIKEYHTDVIALQALEVENNKINTGDSTEIERYVFANKDKYASGEYDLSSIIKSYNELIAGVNNLTTPIDDDEEEQFDINFEEEVFNESMFAELLKEYNIDTYEEEDDDVFKYDDVDILIEEDDDEW